MKKSTKKNKKGFTLIELLIVVAIIAILAAIAIPQFSAYRIKGYNAAASSDIRNGKTAEEALFADFQGYGTTGNTGALGTIDLISPAPISFTDTSVTPNAVRTLDTSLSNGVGLVANAEANPGASYTIQTKHKQGDRLFAADNADTILRWSVATAGTALADSDRIASTTAVDITTAGFTAL